MHTSEPSRSPNVQWQAPCIDKAAHAALKGQRPCVLWLTGLPAAGKSTIANVVERRLHGLGRHTYLLHGDNIRHGLNRDLGFSDVALLDADPDLDGVRDDDRYRVLRIRLAG